MSLFTIEIHHHHHSEQKEKKQKRCGNCSGSGISKLEFAMRSDASNGPVPFGMLVAPAKESVIIKESPCPACHGQGVISY